ncbi:zinc finger BED domain-containing protein RICESLEEPER 2-like [Zingiber officinale]|nr:zinc finger BED domain-containing protein RICESLEEPER 2-like [Zingiber officinale]
MGYLKLKILFSMCVSVKHIAASETRVNIFSEISKQLKLSSKKLVLDCCTRWNATFCMLSAALEFKDIFPRYAARDVAYTFLPSEDDWKKVNVVCSFLEEFNEVTHLISGSEYPTSNLFLTEFYTIKKLLNQASSDEGKSLLNATFCMLSAALEFKDIFPRYAARDVAYTFLPSEDDWKKVSVVCSFLEEFNEVTHLISGSEYPTSNLFLTEFYTIKKLLNQASSDEGSFMAAMANKMKTKFDKYWGDSNLLISIAAVLDPRNKMKLIEWCFLEIYSPNDAMEHISTVHETLRMLYNEYVEAHKTTVGSSNVQDETQRESFIGRTNLNGRGKGKVRA